jgi:hypothetical protein
MRWKEGGTPVPRSARFIWLFDSDPDEQPWELTYDLCGERRQCRSARSRRQIRPDPKRRPIPQPQPAFPL